MLKVSWEPGRKDNGSAVTIDNPLCVAHMVRDRNWLDSEKHWEKGTTDKNGNLH